MHSLNDENANDGMVNWGVWGKKPYPLNKIGPGRGWQSRQLSATRQKA